MTLTRALRPLGKDMGFPLSPLELSKARSLWHCQEVALLVRVVHPTLPSLFGPEPGALCTWFGRLLEAPIK